LACDRSRPSLHLAGLHIPRCGDRKRGIGRSVLVHLTNTADTLGVVLTLDVDEDPDPDHCEEQMTPVDLKAWYTRYGFVKVGLRDGRYWQMERLPRSSLVNAENA
jgi:ribosomal protein S18 acetylase RimI-like enzyme